MIYIKNADGMYSYDEVIARLDKAINAYDEVKEYSDERCFLQIRSKMPNFTKIS